MRTSLPVARLPSPADLRELNLSNDAGEGQVLLQRPPAAERLQQPIDWDNPFQLGDGPHPFAATQEGVNTLL
jgi:hypothetical protein